jgi:adenine-specific DNA-methyltransferase
MQPNLLKELETVIESIEEYNSENGILKNKLIEDAFKCEAKLIKILLQNESVKKHFFTEVEDILVFNSLKFQQFLSQKDFLPDSYTAFKNKIGLTVNGQFISQSKDVVLDFPYKDCVLEGGQTKEDTKRKEVFWNETLAPDEIDVLLEPKILTSAKRYTKEGEERVKSFNRDENGVIKDNLIIKGNNLLALHSLKKEFKGKVKLIYIDPPYNTGNDSFGYNDKFNHSTWLTFMKNRLEVARELLNKKGFLFVHISQHEFEYLKILLNEIFSNNGTCTFTLAPR